MWFNTVFFIPPNFFYFNGEKIETRADLFTRSGEKVETKSVSFTFSGIKL